MDAANGTGERTLTLNSLRVFSSMLQRIAMTRAGITFTGKRDLYETLGYKRDLEYEDYRERYERGDISTRIINAFPAATWHNRPIIRERDSEGDASKSAFEAAWEKLTERIGVYYVFEQADRLASIGHFAVIVIGMRGQLDWKTQATRMRGEEDVLYLAAYSEEHATLRTLISNPASPLFGMPGSYDIDFSRSSSRNSLPEDLRPALTGFTAKTEVNSSRVIHIAEDGLEDRIVGTPRLRSPWNRLDDLDKVMGGSGEMFWKDAKRRLILALKENAQLENEDELTTEVEEFMHELRDFLRVQNMDVTSLQGNTPDPSKHADKLLDMVAGSVGIPKRMLVGSERGELASSQDENNWSQRIMERQKHHAEPVILRPFIDRLIELGALPKPANGYEVEWPNLCSATDKENAEIALTKSKAIKEYAGTNGSPEDYVPSEIFLKDIMGFSKEQIKRIEQILDMMFKEDIEESRIAEEGDDAA